MKILHTADWHLGKRLDRFTRLEEQQQVMEEIVAIADQQQVELVLVAGDLFDTFNPGTDAIELFYKTMKQLSKNGHRPVIAISGNHDSPGWVDAPDPLARECGIILIGYPNATVRPLALEHFRIDLTVEGMVELHIKTNTFPVRILHTPYANEARLKQYLGEDKEAKLNEVLAASWKKLADTYCDNNGVNLLVAHLYMNKKGTPLMDEPEGEKPLRIGNADLIYTDAIPPQLQYTALGHLHGFRNIGSAEKPVVYSSSPLCYSFSEAGQSKYVAIVEVEPGNNATYEKIPLKSGKPLYRKTFDSVDDAANWLTQNQDAWVELTVETDTFLTADERKRLYQSHNGIVYLLPRVRSVDKSPSEISEINLNQSITTLFRDYFKSRNNALEPNEEMMHLFNEILHES